MATLKSRLMRFALLVPLTTSCLLPSLVIRRLSKPQVTQIATLFCVAVKNQLQRGARGQYQARAGSGWLTTESDDRFQSREQL